MLRGVYFLADDSIVELAIAFLNSFRKYNPQILLCLVPFNSNISKLKQLQEKYNFSIYARTKICNACDDISTRFHGQVVGHYRKIAIWEGEFDEFIYIDVDTIVLGTVDFVFNFLSKFDFITSHSNLPRLRKWVWNKSIHNVSHLTDEQIAFSANTGFIASKKGVLTLEGIQSKVGTAVELSPHMTFLCQEQSFLNYLIVTSGKRYTSLLVLLHVFRRLGISHAIMLEHWAGMKGVVIENGQVPHVSEQLIQHFGISHSLMLEHRANLKGIVIENDQIPHVSGRLPVFLMHWAGRWQPRLRDKIFFFLLRILGLKKKNDKLIVRFFMPYRHLWRHYRFMH